MSCIYCCVGALRWSQFRSFQTPELLPATQRHISHDPSYTPVTNSKLASFLPLCRHSVIHKYINSFLSQNIYLFQALSCHLTSHHKILSLTFSHSVQRHVFTFMRAVIGWNNQYSEHGWSLYCRMCVYVRVCYVCVCACMRMCMCVWTSAMPKRIQVHYKPFPSLRSAPLIPPPRLNPSSSRNGIELRY
jgi:hypothetical protein